MRRNSKKCMGQNKVVFMGVAKNAIAVEGFFFYLINAESDWWR